MTAIAQAAGAASFSEMLKAASWDAHEDAARTPFTESLLAGDLTRDRYAELVAQQYLIYAVLEEAAETMAADAVARSFVSEDLTRLPALEADLTFLLGANWANQIEPRQATQAYTARLLEVCFDWPGGFVAHHYVRYLGDLSGGQFIGRVVARVYGLEGGEGTSFYRFDRLDDIMCFKDAYRARLDAAPWDDDEQRRIIDEVLLAYRLNTDVLAGLTRPPTTS